MDKFILVGKTPVAIPDDQMIQWAMWFGKSHRNMARDIFPAQKPLRKGNARMLKILNRRRAQTVYVYTSFLALDHNHFGGTPLLFETWIDGGRRCGDLIRYATFDEAIANHNKIIKENLK